MIAYQTVDRENDIWCNVAMLFETKESAEKFFSDKMNVFNTLGYKLEGDETEDDIIYENLSHNHKVIHCEYAGKITILEMSKGILINNKK